MSFVAPSFPSTRRAQRNERFQSAYVRFTDQDPHFPIILAKGGIEEAPSFPSSGKIRPNTENLKQVYSCFAGE
ncbi:hypothetical protein CEXT_73811 [Caerostris extrusa]|uniref:Uncharacterized protein n=1 Tax=Caerostris extrusa TaxID=172846 RepID=A0AAV4V854_CAEEX|nr:hypothetical protein CEXT_73811 [Caerostris extrusa]